MSTTHPIPSRKPSGSVCIALEDSNVPTMIMAALNAARRLLSMVDDLLKLDMHCDDVSELWKTPEGVYVIEDEEGNVLETAINQQDWRRQHRRIYANVKNAKAKDIERFFRTLNERLDARMLPGRCATPGANAAIDEVERARLEKQKNNHELLTEIEFIQVVLEELRDYENAKHSTLGMSPLQWLDKKVEEGWKPRQIDEQAIELIVSDRCQRKVQRGRVEINNIWYWGEEQTATNGELDDVGLWNYNDQKVDIRYNRHDPSHAYAIVNGSIRYLEPVKALVMLDDDAMKDAIATKLPSDESSKRCFWNAHKAYWQCAVQAAQRAYPPDPTGRLCRGIRRKVTGSCCCANRRLQGYR